MGLKIFLNDRLVDKEQAVVSVFDHGLEFGRVEAMWRRHVGDAVGVEHDGVAGLQIDGHGCGA